MSIEKLTSDQVSNLKVGCPTLSKLSLGEDINAFIDDLNAGEGTSVDISEYKQKLNVMCPLNGAKVGDLFDAIIKYHNGESEELPELTENQIAAINHSCHTLDGVNLGDKFAEIIEELSDDGYVTGLSVTYGGEEVVDGSSITVICEEDEGVYRSVPGQKLSAIVTGHGAFVDGVTFTANPGGISVSITFDEDGTIHYETPIVSPVLETPILTVAKTVGTDADGKQIFISFTLTGTLTGNAD